MVDVYVVICWGKETSGNTTWKSHTLPFTYYTTRYMIALALNRDSTNNYNAAGKSVTTIKESTSTFKTRGAYGTSGSNDYGFCYITIGY